MKNIFSFYIKRSLIFVSTLLGQKFLVLSVFAVTLLLLPNDAVTQTSDTLQTEQLQNAMENNDTIVLHSPKKATYYSMALPG
ncbi:MAG: hypothetical protein U9R32_07045, partial [Bacteroidota bacterium]|nr:hypothetical protein [Bacteroidota bacterium]